MRKRVRKQRDNRKVKFFLIAIPLSFLVIFLLSSLIIGLFLRFEYKDWENRFEGSHLSQDFVDFKDKKLKESIDKKIKIFSEAKKDTSFIELTDKEMLYLVNENIVDVLPNGFETEKGYVNSEHGQWNLYMKSNIWIFNPWFVVNLNKDDVEGTDVYVSSISYGSYDISDFGFGKTVKNVNAGIREAMLLLNQEDFTGRRITNIELEPGIAVIKGVK